MSADTSREENSCRQNNNSVKQMKSAVLDLERNLRAANQSDNKLILNLNHEKLKCKGISSQLEEALRENRQLLEILQQKCGEQADASRANSQIDLSSSSCSTMSIVHLQYKYEELLASHHGLLRLLELKSDEIRRVHNDNEQLKSEIEQLKSSISCDLYRMEKTRRKFERMKQRKDVKISKLKTQRETLEMVHNQLITLLHNQCMEKDYILSAEIKNCSDSEKGLLLQEIRKNNILVYENFQIHQQIELLRRSMLKNDPETKNINNNSNNNKNNA